MTKIIPDKPRFIFKNAFTENAKSESFGWMVPEPIALASPHRAAPQASKNDKFLADVGTPERTFFL